ncbi:MAG: fumarylacetoacetate hydrolase family protein [Epsilonproteobacteria bacterium]|nr:fumarylacetoacetate hydrolase family protein [Campylobacterota bacterium]
MNFVVYENEKIYPSKVVCIGRNYVEHIKELGNEMPENMVIFNKPNSSVTNRLFYFGEDVRFEGEISFLIKGGELEGVGFGLDLTNAKIQNYLKSKGLPWERAKAFDRSAVFSKFVKLSGDIESIEMKLFINSSLAQHARYDLMIYKPKEILKEIKSFMSLEDGDIIMSGTPKGVGGYKRGDLFKAFIYLDGKVINECEFKAL